VHVHPDRSFAREHLALSLVERRDSATLLASLDVDRGAAFVVPGAAGRWQMRGADVVCRAPRPEDAAGAR
jgi:hypothetical protein